MKELLQRIAILVLLIGALLLGAVVDYAGARAVDGAGSRGVQQKSEGPLQTQITRLFEALNRRDLDVIRSQISPSRIFVQISDRAGAYLTNSQTLAVMESFLHTHTSMSAKFEFDNSDGENGSASGTLTSQREGRTLSYRLNFGFTRSAAGVWLLTRISMQ